MKVGYKTLIEEAVSLEELIGPREFVSLVY